MLTGTFQSIHDSAPAAGRKAKIENLTFRIRRLDILPTASEVESDLAAGGMLTKSRQRDNRDDVVDGHVSGKPSRSATPGVEGRCAIQRSCVRVR
jgi:hypothetical protein